MVDSPVQEFFMGPGFWVAVGADFLLVVSVFFTVLYAIALFLATFVPGDSRFAPNAYCIPALLVVSVLFSLSPAGLYLVEEARSALLVTAVSRGVPFQPWLILLWLVVAVGAFLLLFVRQVFAARALARMRRAGPDHAFASAVEASGCKRPVTLLLADEDGLVASWGLFRPVVMVPADFMRRYGERERYCMYLHELVHIRWMDSWKNLLAAFMKILFWFNPGVLHALGRFGNHVEIACDRRVMAAGSISPDEYARLISRTLRAGNGLMSGFSGDCDDVVRRLRYIYRDNSLESFTRVRVWTTACVALVAACFWASLGSKDTLQAMMPGPDPETLALMRGEMREIAVYRWCGMLGEYSITVVASRDDSGQPRTSADRRPVAAGEATTGR